MSGHFRVAFVSDKCAPFFFGGYEVRVFELARCISTVFDVQVLTSVPEGTGDELGVRFVKAFPSAFQRFPTGGRSLIHTSLVCASCWLHPSRFKPFDVVIVEAIPYLHLPAVIAAAKQYDCRIVVDVSEAWSEFLEKSRRLPEFRRHVIRTLLARSMRDADAVIAVSQATARSLVEHYAVPVEKLHVIPNGLRTESHFRHAESNSVRTIGVSTIARLVPNKRVEDLLMALNRLKTDYGWDGRAVIIGDGPCREQLERTARKLSLARNVEFTGFISEDAKSDLLQNSEVFVLTSEREGFSIASLEAMGQGVPVIASKPETADVFGVSDFVHPGETGFYYPTGDSNRLAELLLRCWSDPELLARLGKNAQSLSLQYSWSTAALALQKLLSIICVSAASEGTK